jgi:hypothetical protein
MLNCIPIRVESYSGGRADQEPRVLCRGGRRLEVAAIVDRWFQGGTDPAAGWAEMPPVADIPPDTAASIIYTSGTTGLAKGGGAQPPRHHRQHQRRRDNRSVGLPVKYTEVKMQDPDAEVRRPRAGIGAVNRMLPGYKKDR